MPDKWEYPWYASWDLAFHSVVLAHTDPAMAKNQLLLLAREWYMNPNGQLPAYEWNFSDVNPPVQAWAALAVFRIDGATDFDFLARVFNKLLINFTWWVNREDARGDNIFEGGFLGLDNIGPFDRSVILPGDVLEQSDGTAWMAKFCLNMLEMALLLANRNPVYEDVAIKFFEHFALIAARHGRICGTSRIGFFYDCLRTKDGSAITGAGALDGRASASLRRRRARPLAMGGDCPCFANGRAGTSSTNWGRRTISTISRPAAGLVSSRSSRSRASSAFWLACSTRANFYRLTD